MRFNESEAVTVAIPGRILSGVGFPEILQILLA
jgi:hypothetical protein